MSTLAQDVPRNGRPFAPPPDMPLLPSPPHCRNCGDRMRLWRNGRDNPRVWGCGACHAYRSRLRRAEVRSLRCGKLLKEILYGRLRAESLLRHLQALLRLGGGWSGLCEKLSAVDRAKLAVKLAEVAEREEARAEEAERRKALAESELQSPAMQADLARMAQQWCEQHPLQAVRSVLCDKPHLVVRALIEDEGGRAALARAGWTEPSADAASPEKQPLRRWSEEEIKLLGTMTDAAVGQLLNRPRVGVQRKRTELGIDPVGGPMQHTWTKEQIALLGRLPDGEVGRRIELCRAAVMKKRRELGILAWGKRQA